MAEPPTLDAASGGALRSALKAEDDSERGSSSKAVQIAEPVQDTTTDDPQPKRQFSAGVGKRLSGRPHPVHANSSRTSLLSQSSLEALSGLAHSQSPLQGLSDSEAPHGHHRHRLDLLSEKLIAQVAEWLEHEKAKKQNRKSLKLPHSRRKLISTEAKQKLTTSGTGTASSTVDHDDGLERTNSIESGSSEVSFDRLQRIIDDSMSALGLKTLPHYSTRLSQRRAHKKRSFLHRTASSDTEYHDGDVLVPKCDAWLDNSKTTSYAGGKAAGTDDTNSISSHREDKERKAWTVFKNDIIRITHTLRIKGWRRVPLDSGDSISVERLSGALTNAVYVVSPPQDLATKTESEKKPPAKLLLRVYGPQVENIIDRENELSVLRRLARKRIGPRMLGTFENGRFEQFFNAITLTPAHLREPETSKQIAKRMRELHDGMELLEEERDEGPAVLKNWDNWLENVEKIATFLDRKILSGNLGTARGPADAWKERGLVCGVEWPMFKGTVDKYRQWLEVRYKGPQGLREQLVFAHNDTQYGNILRVQPDDQQSPLLQPQNEHKRLIVIDFEYAAANVRGLEFANHFTEWTYNYHDTKAPYACNIANYPTPEEQRRFLKAYIEHRPKFPHAGSTPNLTPLDTPTETPGTPGLSQTTPSTSSIKEFMLDARVPSGGWKEDERRGEEHLDKEIAQLTEETRLWRIANSAFWVAWGFMQAKIPDLDWENAEEKPADKKSADESAQPTADTNADEEEDDADAFDYLGYAQDRALFFWGDCILMGLIKQEELPEPLRSKVKLLDY